MPYGTCWGSWLLAISSTMVVVNPPTTHMSPCFPLHGFIVLTPGVTMPWCRSFKNICVSFSSLVFISPPMTNLPSQIRLLAPIMELLCSRFCMSWARWLSVSVHCLLDGACTLTTSMPSSSPSPGMVHRKACATRRCPRASYNFCKIRPCVHLQRLSSHSVR